MSDAMKLCPPHLYIRFKMGDFLEDVLVHIAPVMVEGECIDCEAYEKGKLPELANPDPIMDRWMR